jgi:cyanophycin synthetase
MTGLGNLVSKMGTACNRKIGLVGIAGDRRDSDIKEMGALASRIFDFVCD